MGFSFQFSDELLNTVVGGLSVLDIPRLEISSKEDAYAFAKAYGYDLTDTDDLEVVWTIHAQAVSYLQENLCQDNELIPEVLTQRNRLQDIAHLLLYASHRDTKANVMQRWSCAILRVMHVIFHIKNDLYNMFAVEIYEQILSPIRTHLKYQESGTVFLGGVAGSEEIHLHSFDVKPLKSRASSVTKLLAKRDEVALRLLDKVGVRFVTEDYFDSFRVLRYLIEQHLISMPNAMPDQSKNTLYPTNLFLEVMRGLQGKTPVPTATEIEKHLADKLAIEEKRAEYKDKLNNFSGENYRAIKFISRQLVKLPMGDKKLHVFFPFEVQIVDADTHLVNVSGPSSHLEYKKRQISAARTRAFGFSKEDERMPR